MLEQVYLCVALKLSTEIEVINKRKKKQKRKSINNENNLKEVISRY